MGIDEGFKGWIVSFSLSLQVCCAVGGRVCDFRENACVCVYLCVCVFVCEREKEKKSACVCFGTKETEIVF